MQDAALDPELADEVRRRLECLKMGTACQADVDQLIFPCILAYNGDPLVRRVGWRALASGPAHTFRAAHLPDIGRHVRAMVLGIDNKTDYMLHLIRYSMPYIKHNRLAFMPFERASLALLRDLVRLQLATCLGIYSETSKRPVWRLRVEVTALFVNLLANGSSMDLHVFCSTHVSLVRLALIEYYVFFVTTYMPTESGLQHRHFGSEVPTATIFRQIGTVVDSFRQTQFQGASLEWEHLNTRAQIAVEKCNRCSKGIAKAASPTTAVPTESLEDVRLARRLPLFSHPRNLPEWSPATLLRVARVHAMIQTHPLPFNATLDQTRVIRRMASRDSAQATNACVMYVCLQCPHRVPDRVIRCGASGIVCGHCLSADYVFKVSVLGRIVSVCDRKFYLCPVCVQVHAWTGTGYELHTCAATAAPRPRPRGCIICTHTSSINKVTVLDSALGVMQHLTLCNRHMPYDHQMRYVHNLNSLVVAIQRKFKK